MSKPAVSIQQLSFRYPGADKNCFERLDLTIGRGDRFGLFGPNGAGKTTLMNCMTGLLRVDQGLIELLGHPLSHDNKELKRLFGLVPQDFSFYHELSCTENLAFFGAWAGMSKTTARRRTAQLLSILDLEEQANKPVQRLSGGMKRRLNLAIGVMHSPEILFLDEPTVGVDVQTRTAIINYLKELNNNGTTLIYTSHQLNEAEELCDQIALIDNGAIIAYDTLDHLLAEHGQIGLEGLFINLTGNKFRQE